MRINQMTYFPRGLCTLLCFLLLVSGVSAPPSFAAAKHCDHHGSAKVHTSMAMPHSMPDQHAMYEPQQAQEDSMDCCDSPTMPSHCQQNSHCSQFTGNVVAITDLSSNAFPRMPISMTAIPLDGYLNHTVTPELKPPRV